MHDCVLLSCALHLKNWVGNKSRKEVHPPLTMHLEKVQSSGGGEGPAVGAKPRGQHTSAARGSALEGP